MNRDYSLDEIGRRLSGEGLSEQERVLAEDDKVRVQWVRDRINCNHYTNIIDVGASDGSVTDNLTGTRFLIERHRAHVDALARESFENGCWLWLGGAHNALISLPTVPNSVTVCAEVLEHMDQLDGEDIIARAHGDLLVTVPNLNSASFDATGRSRWDWPDHRRHFTADGLRNWLESCDWRVAVFAPIVGTLDDSIWLGALCRRA